MLAFYVLFFFRPEDFVPGLAMVPMEKIVGGLAALALLGAVLGGRFRHTREVTLMASFLAYLCLCIPTSIWPGGSFSLVVDGFSKYILVVLATICMVDSLARCRRIMLIQTLALLLMAALALGQARELNRMYGVGKMFSDPNDFALNLCMILPFCAAFCLSARSRLRRMFWAGAACLAVVAIISTYSRGGFLALLATLVALAWRFRGAVRSAVVTALAAGAIAAVALSGSPYLHRLDTILHPNTDKTGSAQAREGLFERSLAVTLEHPLLGVGPGDFQIISGDWHVTHDTFTQLSAEAGIPSLILFLAIMWCGFRNSRSAREQWAPELVWFTDAVECSLTGYLVGAVFLSTAYWLAPYLVIAYAAILSRLARSAAASGGTAENAGGRGPRFELRPTLAETLPC
ncbi:MAG TPA: O-antigen ligase family protein [Terriglobales bacterium]|nr:O-antigen ligase family protein [Terriglobales bacterium]